MIRGLLIILASSFAGTLGFAILLGAPRRTWIPASLVGAAAFTLYWVLSDLGMNEAGAIFCGSFAGSVMGQLLARKMKTIATIFNALSIVAFVPGLGLYRCMELFARNQTSAGARTGIQAMVSIVMITLGLTVGTFLFRALFVRKKA